MVSYAAGASDIKFKPFIILSALGRLPGMVGCLLMGTMFVDENYTGVIIIGAIAVLTFCICVAFRKKIQILMDKFYDKITK